MRIVRPYGSSRSRKSGEEVRRVLVDSTAERTEWDIPPFARSHDKLVIAQWISTIDKIACKPAGRKKPTPAQYALREKLGNVCWLRMTEGGHLPGAAGADREHLNNIWWFKIHPYGTETEEPRPRRDGSLPPSAELKGRWFEAFAGTWDPEKTSARETVDILAQIAERIEKHLYETEYRLGQNKRPKRLGRIEARAESIEGNVLHVPIASEDQRNQPTWTEDDKQAYTRNRDPIHAIRQAAEKLESNKGRISLSDAAEVLFGHWAKIFVYHETGKPMGVRDASERHPGMFALHQTLKECYRRLLKRTRKDTRHHRKENPDGRRLSALLPRNLDDALRLMRMQAANAELAELVRLGKIIHYAASEGRADRAKSIREHWPQNVAQSRFWQSDGQAEIKRAEAFVRVWRQVLALAGLTLKDWLSFPGDLLGGDRTKNAAIKNAIEALRTDASKHERFDRKLNVLFGERTDLLGVGSADDRVDLLCALVDGAANLRHAIFHFKGRGQLLDELARLPAHLSAPVKQASERLWEKDVTECTARLKKTLVGAHVEEFITQEQAMQVFVLVADNTLAELPLPRFARILERRKNAWEETIRLPEPANLRALEDSARLCQYTLLKLVYERPFRAWLTKQDAQAISNWIDRAVARATEAAKALNAQGSEAGRKVIAARAADLPKPSVGGDITEFFFALSAATASEMRVQSGYETDREKAREQAEYINDLLCDVTILAFDAYTAQAKLGWLLDIARDRPATCLIAELPDPQRDLAAEPWQSALYLILHVLPVESVGQLLHQLLRWKTAAGRDVEWSEKDQARLQRLLATMTLYLDMHDAKFEGGSALAGCEEFAGLFESEAGFRKVFPAVLDENAELRIPRRGLREIVRFGHLPLLKAICGVKKIDEDTIDRVFSIEGVLEGGESQIAQMQKRREELHDAWIVTKRGPAIEKDADGEAMKRFGAEELHEYCEILTNVSRHREQSNFVNLVDHVRAYRLVLAVFGRLVDYVGLFERDLYFVTLALLHQRGLRAEDLLEQGGLEHLYGGRIIFALDRRRTDTPKAAEISMELAKHFTELWTKGNPNRRIRNDLAHLNTLQGTGFAPRLTHWVNQTRQLMAYDRKLKNAISKSVLDLLDREGIKLRWTMDVSDNTHDLTNATLATRCAEHLGNKKLTLKGAGPKDREVPINERLHSESYVAMVASAFEGTPIATRSILDDLSRVAWEASVAPRRLPRDPRQGPPRKPFPGGRNRRDFSGTSHHT